ncbi:hypothetical protein AJ80_08254 [Polytolypa hystricis UAMH7299]|uniref:Uncharacterized protein n=1 Tax=Polytolypa hystricis (strain UAMH7299) TaxID=1447883 RepID=A0A2B7XB38_POLH7|nr:hypothetical protein AJ80_08254 [Polytolypa hystricis UAMH7299]
MLFQRAAPKGKSGSDSEDPGPKEIRNTYERPLVCMIYFFASQMPRNIESITPPKEGVLPMGARQGDTLQVHRLDSLLSEVQYHARLSRLVTRFETFPVEMPPPGIPRGMSREYMHDTLLLVSFRNKHAWEQWILTKPWQKFMERTEQEGVFRRIPHVRCAGSLKGLRDPLEVLMS